jgi:hypothetical protein
MSKDEELNDVFHHAFFQPRNSLGRFDGKPEKYKGQLKVNPSKTDQLRSGLVNWRPNPAPGGD